ncbi:MAG: OmpA family protein [Bacteroidota bacterium]
MNFRPPILLLCRHCLLPLLLFGGLEAYAQSLSLQLNYASDEFELTSVQQMQLDKWLSELAEVAVENIQISGHTDTVANIAYNQILSRKRATGVYEYLKSKGLDTAKVELNWFGESQAQSPLDLLADRRVSLIAIYSIPALAPPPLIKTDDSRISELYKQTTIPIQEFNIPLQEDTILACASGTLIHIPVDAFELSIAQKRKRALIRFQVKEVYKKSAMVLENLTTTSNGRILESDGMVYINAILEGDTLRLQKDLAIMMPTTQEEEGRRVFEGRRDPHTEVMNWSIGNNSVLRKFTVRDIANCLRYNEEWEICQRAGLRLAINPEEQMAFCIDALLGCLRNVCESCPFFFCRIKRVGSAFGGIVNQDTRSNNRIVRRCQRTRRRIARLEKKGRMSLLNRGVMDELLQSFLGRRALRGARSLSPAEEEIMELTQMIQKNDSLIKAGLIDQEILGQCNQLDSLFEAYGVDNPDDLVLAINRPLLNQFGLDNMEELLDTLPKVNLENLEVAYNEQQISYDDFKFYVFNSSTLGWKNIDVFKDVPPEQMVTLKVDLPPNRQRDCKLVFKERVFVLPGQLAEDYFYFEGVPQGEKAWIIGLKYENDQPLLAMKEIEVAESMVAVEFEALPLPELKKRLKLLDFK